MLQQFTKSYYYLIVGDISVIFIYIHLKLHLYDLHLRIHLYIEQVTSCFHCFLPLSLEVNKDINAE